jgi:hypothetical protein
MVNIPITPFNIPAITFANPADPTIAELHVGETMINTVVAGLDNIIQFLQLNIPILQLPAPVAAAADAAARLAHSNVLNPTGMW